MVPKFMPTRKVWGVMQKDYLKNRSLVKPTSSWTFKDVNSERGTEAFLALGFDKKDFPKPKPIGTIERCIKLAARKDDAIILDSFAGSGTTAQAVIRFNREHGGNRKFILIEMMEYADEVTTERTKRVIAEEQSLIDEGGNNSFSFYELGAPIILDDKINPDVPIETVKEFIYYLETKQAYKKDSDEKALLGVNSGCAYYFFYTPGKTVTLNRRKLSCIKTKAESYVIYADNCTLSDEELKNYNITFKKPGDIERF